MAEEIFFSKFLLFVCSMVNILLLGGYTPYKKNCWIKSLMSVISALGRLRQGDCREFKVSLSYLYRVF